MKEEIWFRFLLTKNLPRTTTQQEYKRISQWLRICRHEVSKLIDLSELDRVFTDMIVFGTGAWYRLEDGR